MAVVGYIDGYVDGTDEYGFADTQARTDISNIKDGSSIDSFGDVEAALGDKVTKLVAGGVLGTDGNPISVETPLTLSNGEMGLMFGNIEEGIQTSPPTAGDVYSALATKANSSDVNSKFAASVSLLDDTVGWTGKNFNKSDANHTFIKGSARTYNFLFAKDIVQGKKYTVSFDVSGISGYTGNNAIGVRFIEDAVSTDDWYVQTSASGRVSHTFTARSDAQVGELKSCVYCYIPNTEGNNATIALSNVMFADADVIDQTYEPYHESVEEYAFSRSEQAVLGAVNELNNIAISDTIQGLETTVNADKSVSIAAGTVTGGNYVCTLTLNAGIPAGKRVFLSGCPKGGSTNTYMLAYQNASDQWINAQYDVGNGTWIEDGIKRVAISIINGVTVSAMTFKPMISLSDKTPYAPFAMTNRELTEAVAFGTGTIEDVAEVTQYAQWSFIQRIGNLAIFQYRFTVGASDISTADTVIADFGIGALKNDTIFQFTNRSDGSDQKLLAVNSQGKLVLVSGFTLETGKTYVGNGAYVIK